MNLKKKILKKLTRILNPLFFTLLKLSKKISEENNLSSPNLLDLKTTLFPNSIVSIKHATKTPYTIKRIYPSKWKEKKIKIKKKKK